MGWMDGEGLVLKSGLDEKEKQKNKKKKKKQKTKEPKK